MFKLSPVWLERHSRQIRFSPIGQKGQQVLKESSLLLVGCGGLGTAIADHLVRGGIGRIRIVDGDSVQLHNLHRQSLYDERDVASGEPKAVAAGRKLRAINSEVEIETYPFRLDRDNIQDLLDGVSLVLDGTDNFGTRYLVNDACVKRGIPWIYGGVAGSTGMTMNILPDTGPCLRCLFPELPDQSLTAETHGIINCLPALVASIQVAEAYKILLGSPEVRRHLLHLDIWSNEYRLLEIKREPGCPCCGRRHFEFLEGEPDHGTP